MQRLNYLNKVDIEITEIEEGIEVQTNHAGVGEEVVYETKMEVADRLENIKYYYAEEYDGNAEEHKSYEKLNKLITLFKQIFEYLQRLQKIRNGQH